MARTYAEEAVTEPVFDFSRTSYKDGRAMSRLQMEIQVQQRRINELPTEQAPVLLDELDVLLDRTEEFLIKSVRAVPRDWIVAGAPEVIEWGNREALQWLRSDKFQALVNAMQEAQRKGN